MRKAEQSQNRGQARGARASSRGLHRARREHKRRPRRWRPLDGRDRRRRRRSSRYPARGASVRTWLATSRDARATLAKGGARSAPLGRRAMSSVAPRRSPVASDSARGSRALRHRRSDRSRRAERRAVGQKADWLHVEARRLRAALVLGGFSMRAQSRSTMGRSGTAYTATSSLVRRRPMGSVSRISHVVFPSLRIQMPAERRARASVERPPRSVT